MAELSENELSIDEVSLLDRSYESSDIGKDTSGSGIVLDEPHKFLGESEAGESYIQQE